MESDCSICGAAIDGTKLCVLCTDLLRWFRGYFAHIPDLPPQITPETRFVEDLGADSLDWMNWPLEAEEKLGIVLSDRQFERALTVGQFIRALRGAGAEFPEVAEIRLASRPRWWSPYRWEVVELAEGRSSGAGSAFSEGADVKPRD